MITIEQIAKICHDANKSLCETQEDHSQTKWEFAPEWQRDSVRMGIKNILDNPNTTPEQSHESWLKVKTDDGWKYGEVKDVIKKEHPCFLPYDQLPEGQKVKDLLFTTIAKTLIKELQ